MTDKILLEERDKKSRELWTFKSKSTLAGPFQAENRGNLTQQTKLNNISPEDKMGSSLCHWTSKRKKSMLNLSMCNGTRCTTMGMYYKVTRMCLPGAKEPNHGKPGEGRVHAMRSVVTLKSLVKRKQFMTSYQVLCVYSESRHLEKVGDVAYKLELLKEQGSQYVSPSFVEEHIEFMEKNCEVKWLKRKPYSIVKFNGI
ncbi:hypothetical protein Tco_0369952 [Tanacetum coccineum]|uniref:Uncharacterized protein n=1 Tax=Tanacetum coccineum TaxID=301880 RepID=A0ABQ4ZR27_9ASTR